MAGWAWRLGDCSGQYDFGACEAAASPRHDHNTNRYAAGMYSPMHGWWQVIAGEYGATAGCSW